MPIDIMSPSKLTPAALVLCMHGDGFRTNRARALAAAQRLFNSHTSVVKVYIDGDRVYLTPEKPTDFIEKDKAWSSLGRVIVCDDVPQEALDAALGMIRRAGRCTTPFVRTLTKEVK